MWLRSANDEMGYLADTLNYMENLVKAGVDIFDVDLGC